MNPPSLARLYALRICYLLLVVGLGPTVWPSIVGLERPDSLMQGVVRCMLGALSLLALLGLRQPMRMLPLLVFEVAWKAIWLGATALPLWRAGQLDETYAATAWECAIVVLFVVAIPWGRFWREFVVGRGERWGAAQPTPREARAG